ncbi:MAG: indole-3-glycerol phosphate synthase TrpC [Deltaproteobacteria bacterium]|nr:indole-3-glycerol phosphate synthase TrpC [Deltaproteobacteria bacterium]
MILDDIVKAKKIAVDNTKKYYSIERVKEKLALLKPTKNFTEAVSTKGGPNAIRIIAEVKRASPSKGVLRQSFMAFEIARTYEINRAAAISVLTEEKFFLGSLEYLLAIGRNVRVPVLRKDFIFDEYQVYESRVSGADAILLIVAILEKEQLKNLMDLSTSLGMATLVEVHNEAELKIAIEAGAKIIGINNRDLTTFKTDINTTIKLAPLVPEGTIIVSESGINTFEDILALRDAGVSAFLVGEALVKEDNIAKKLKELQGFA